MSLLDAPLAAIDHLFALRTPPVGADDPAARLIARTTARLRPNPYFRRRLRSSVINRYVAVREGLVPQPPHRSEMGRLGRAVLYATFALSVSVTAVGAASTSALPGDPLYLVKLSIESTRLQIAPPVARPFLAQLALEERLSELEQLARDGRWSLIPGAAASVAAARSQLDALGGLTASSAADLQRHLSVLGLLLSSAPDAARAGIERAIVASSGEASPAVTHGHVAGAGSNSGQGGQGGGGATASTPAPSRHPQATHSPKASPSAPSVPAPKH